VSRVKSLRAGLDSVESNVKQGSVSGVKEQTDGIGNEFLKLEKVRHGVERRMGL